jgi:hypothetical protein
MPHVETLLPPGVVAIGIENVYLQAGFEDVLGGTGCTGAATDRYFPGHGEDNQFSFVFFKW